MLLRTISQSHNLPISSMMMLRHCVLDPYAIPVQYIAVHLGGESLGGGLRCKRSQPVAHRRLDLLAFDIIGRRCVDPLLAGVVMHPTPAGRISLCLRR